MRVLRIRPDLPMGPLTGLIVENGIWTGDIPEIMCEAILQDVEEDIDSQDLIKNCMAVLEENPQLLPIVLREFSERVAMTSALRTCQRLHVEFGGCAIEGPPEED